MIQQIPKIRKDNTIVFDLVMTVGGNPRDMRGLDLSVVLRDPYGRMRSVTDWSLVDEVPYNVIEVTLQGVDLADAGDYMVLVYENAGKPNQLVADKRLVELVPESSMEEIADDGSVRKTLNLEVSSVLFGGRGGEDIAALVEAINDLKKKFCEGVEGHVRVAGVSDPDFRFREYKQINVGEASVFDCLRPCLVGNNFTGEGTCGKILHILNALDWAHDTDGNLRQIDGSEGEVLICNTSTIYAIVGTVTVGGIRYDVALYSRAPFEWCGHQATELPPYGLAPHYCVAHLDTDGVTRMHSVLNYDWDGSWTAPMDVVGKYVATDNGQGGITETFDADAYVVGDAKGKASTGLALYTGEQYAMNLNADPGQTVPYYNSHVWALEMFHVGVMLAEGGTFYAHDPSLMGSGFCSNSNATAASHWDAADPVARNGFRYQNSSKAWVYLGISVNTNTDFGFGRTGDNLRPCVWLTNWRSPWDMFEQQMVLAHAAANGIAELTWFAYNGNIYKYRSVPGFAGLAEGVMTAVVWKRVSSTLAEGAVQPGTSTDIGGNKVEWMVSSCVYRGIITDVSPSWWTSGLWLCQWGTDNTMRAYLCTDQAKMILSSQASTVDDDVELPHENADGYQLLPVLNATNGYSKDHCDETLFWPRSVASQSGGSLSTFNAVYLYLAGTRPASGKKVPRGFRRGNAAVASVLSPMCVVGIYAPSGASANLGFGICCRIEPES
jgi:hypothetical protein